MGEIHVHELMSLDGVIDAPTWTFEYEHRPATRPDREPRVLSELLPQPDGFEGLRERLEHLAASELAGPKGQD